MTYTPFKVRAKLFLKTIMPTALFAVILKVWRSTFSKLSSGSDMDIVAKYTKEFLHAHGYNVVGGPFKGLSYVSEAAGSSYLIKLIGVYEEILHDTMKRIMKGGYTTMIDIGCAEGYYLVGVGKQSPHTTLIGYDIDEKALLLTKELYEKNHLTNELVLLGNCTPEDLQTRIDDKTFLMCDAEGFEAEILNPHKTPALKHVQTFVVELHDFAVPHVKELLVERFENTHTIQTIVFKNGNPESYPFLMNIKNKHHLYTLLRERGEQEQEWLVMERK
jgi:hypothetical protein